MNAILNGLLESEEENTSLIENYMSTRSILYNLEPVGVGTPYTESLTSYISRLASIHNLPIAIFIKNLIAPLLSSIKGGYTRSKKYQELSKYINGNTTLTTTYISAIEKLTCRNDISYLTMNNWKGILQNNIIDNHRKWCPHCINKMKSESNIVYEPLIWYMAGLNKCDIHEIKLHNKCPYCQKQSSYLLDNFIVGHCPYCKKWLGDSYEQQAKDYLTHKEKFITDNVKELIMNASFQDSFPIRNSSGILLNKIKEELGFEHLSKLAYFLEITKRKLYSWSNGEFIPQPDQLINIAEKTNTSIFYLYCDEKIELNLNVSINKSGNKQKNISKEEIKEYLIQAINSEIPKSMSSVSKEHGFNFNTARLNFPELTQVIIDNFDNYKKQLAIEKKEELEKILYECLDSDIPISLNEFSIRNNISKTTIRKKTPEFGKKIARRYKDYMDKIQKDYKEKVLNELEKIILDLHQSGLYPSVKRIQKIISNPQVMRQDDYKKKRKVILISLGYKI